MSNSEIYREAIEEQIEQQQQQVNIQTLGEQEKHQCKNCKKTISKGIAWQPEITLNNGKTNICIKGMPYYFCNKNCANAFVDNYEKGLETLNFENYKKTTKYLNISLEEYAGILESIDQFANGNGEYDIEATMTEDRQCMVAMKRRD